MAGLTLTLNLPIPCPKDGEHLCWLYKLLSQMRVGNPNWFTQIASATEAGLLRELVLMQAFQFELLRKNTDFLDRIAFMTSLDALTRLDKAQKSLMTSIYAVLAHSSRRKI